jgi:hypothetical protein
VRRAPLEHLAIHLLPRGGPRIRTTAGIVRPVGNHARNPLPAARPFDRRLAKNKGAAVNGPPANFSRRLAAGAVDSTSGQAAHDRLDLKPQAALAFDLFRGHEMLLLEELNRGVEAQQRHRGRPRAHPRPPLDHRGGLARVLPEVADHAPRVPLDLGRAYRTEHRPGGRHDARFDNRHRALDRDGRDLRRGPPLPRASQRLKAASIEMAIGTTESVS